MCANTSIPVLAGSMVNGCACIYMYSLADLATIPKALPSGNHAKACISPIYLFGSDHLHIFEHIYCPLSGLYYNTDKCRSEEIRGDAFSICLFISLFPKMQLHAK